MNQFHCILFAKNHRTDGLMEGREALYERKTIKVATTLLTCHAHQASRPNSGAAYTRGSLSPPPQARSSVPFCSCKPSAPPILSLLSCRFLYVSYSLLSLEKWAPCVFLFSITVQSHIMNSWRVNTCHLRVHQFKTILVLYKRDHLAWLHFLFYSLDTRKGYGIWNHISLYSGLEWGQ